MKPRTRRATAGALIAVALALTSCTSGSGPEPEPPLGPVPVVRTAADLVLPLDAYRFTNKDYAVKARAQARLTADCMRRFGVDYPSTAGTLVAGVDVPDFDHLNDRRYGLIDLDSASVRGYRPASAQPEQQPERAGVKEKAGGFDHTPHTLFLLNGKARPEFAGAGLPVDPQGKKLPDDGCAGEAERTLAGAPQIGNLRLADSLANESFQRAENDSRLRAAVTAWSTCMHDNGYQYTSIWQPNDKNWPREIGPEEIATAKADVECKQRTNLVGTWLAVETAYQHREIDKHSQQLAQLRQYLQNVARNSTRIVGG